MSCQRSESSWNLITIHEASRTPCYHHAGGAPPRLCARPQLFGLPCAGVAPFPSLREAQGGMVGSGGAAAAWRYSSIIASLAVERRYHFVLTPACWRPLLSSCPALQACGWLPYRGAMETGPSGIRRSATPTCALLTSLCGAGWRSRSGLKRGRERREESRVELDSLLLETSGGPAM